MQSFQCICEIVTNWGVFIMCAQLSALVAVNFKLLMLIHVQDVDVLLHFLRLNHT